MILEEISRGIARRFNLPPRVSFLLASALFRLALDLLYVRYVHPTFRYMGFDLHIELGQLLESWLLVGITALVMPHRIVRPSDLYMLMLGFGVIVPTTSQYGLAAEARWVMYMVLGGFLVIAIARRGKRFRVPTLIGGPKAAMVISVVGVIAVLGGIIISGGLRHLNFDLTRVYEYRAEATETIGKGIFGYLNSWGFKVFSLFLLAFALSRKAWPVVLVILGLQTFFFGVSAQKAVLFYPLLVFAVWYFFRRPASAVAVPAGLTFVVVGAALYWIGTGDGWLPSIFIRRMFFVTANNTFDYYAFFSANEHVYWSNSVFSGWLKYPYSASPSLLIGQWRNTDAHVNNSFIATGYMHAGVAGLLFYCLIVGWMFRLIDSLAGNSVNLWFALAVTVVPMFSLLIGSDLPTGLLTKGVAISIALLFLVRRPRRSALVQPVYCDSSGLSMQSGSIMRT